jgi:hypothetical protein
MSSPRDIQTWEVGTTIQRAQSGYHDLSGGHSTGMETMSAGTGNLRQREARLRASAVTSNKPPNLNVVASQAANSQTVWQGCLHLIGSRKAGDSSEPVSLLAYCTAKRAKGQL